MDEKDLFEIAKKQKPKKQSSKTKDGLTTRTFNVLIRNNFTNIKMSSPFPHNFRLKDITEEIIIKKKKLYESVISGSIWKIDMIGEFSVKEICKWLSDNCSRDGFKNE